MKISLGILNMNDKSGLILLLNQVGKSVDEIVILDGGSSDGSLKIPEITRLNCKIVNHKFEGSFAQERNICIENCKSKWILMLDTDEFVEHRLLTDLRKLIKDSRYDAYGLPRYNYVVGDLLKYPDIRTMLFRDYCRWTNNVHETLTGFNSRKNTDYHIYHIKSFERASRQHLRYSQMKGG